MRALSVNLFHSRNLLAERRASKNRDRLALAVMLAAIGLSLAGVIIR